MKKRAIFSEGGIARNSFDLSVAIVADTVSFEVERALRSCLAQTLPGQAVQVLLIGSSEDKAMSDLIQNYGQFIQHYPLPENNDFFGGLQYVMQHVRGRHFLWLDATDFMSDYMLLSQQIYLYDHPEAHGVLVDYWLIENGSDRKIERRSGNDLASMSGIMWRKDSIARSLAQVKIDEKIDPAGLRSVLGVKLKLGHLPIAFFRYTQR